MSLIWWEKTVEYFFVRRYVGDRFIAPLAGKQEAAGDAVIADGTALVLIEFKKDIGCLSSEISKFSDYPLAKSALEHHDAPHFLVFGGADDEDGASHFTLRARQYFSGNYAQVEEVLASGVKFKKFVSYLERVIEFKKSATESGGAGGVGAAAYALVAGVASDGKVVACISLTEFVNKYQPSLNLDSEPMSQEADWEQGHCPR